MQYKQGLTPLAHPTLDKLLCSLMWFKGFEGFLVSGVSVI
jgi:hypothetical protein